MCLSFEIYGIIMGYYYVYVYYSTAILSNMVQEPL